MKPQSGENGNKGKPLEKSKGHSQTPCSRSAHM
jgi:hypothetical protein